MLSLEDLVHLFESHRAAAQSTVSDFSIGERLFQFRERPAIMGVINLSADSWYRESVCLTVEQAIRRACVLSAQGAHIVDVGAESTLAHAARADERTQNAKLLPILEGLRGSGILVSVETYEPAVARACLEAGAKVVNLTGMVHAVEVYRLVAAHEAAVIICYVQGDHVRAVGDFDLGQDPIDGMYEYFAREVERATQAGVSRIFLDPGLGFYYANLRDSVARIRHQMATFLNTFRFRRLGFPICHALPHAFEIFGEEVRCAEPFFAVLAALGKTDLLRTHEVSRTRAVLETLRVY